jgi:uncharacterized protein YbjT (DUF2867 family)
MILVLGAGGNIGRELVKLLAARGAAFRSAHQSPEKVEAAKQAGRDAALVDMRRPETVREALAGAKSLFLLTPEALPARELEPPIVREAASAGVKRIVKLSVWRAHDDYSFGRFHRPGEEAILASGVEYTLLRPNNFMQNMVTAFGHEIRATGVFRLPAGDARSSFVDVRDIAAVAARALTEPGHEGKVYEISGPAALTFHEVAAILSAAAGRPIRYEAVAPQDYIRALTAVLPPELAFLGDAVVDLYHRYMADGSFAEVTGVVEQVTGNKPIDFEAFAAEYAGALRG